MVRGIRLREVKHDEVCDEPKLACFRSTDIPGDRALYVLEVFVDGEWEQVPALKLPIKEKADA